MNNKIKKKDKIKAKKLLKKITEIEGMNRTAYKCGVCGHIFASRYIPYGFSLNLFNLCHCQAANHEPYKEVLTIED